MCFYMLQLYLLPGIGGHRSGFFFLDNVIDTEVVKSASQPLPLALNCLSESMRKHIHFCRAVHGGYDMTPCIDGRVGDWQYKSRPRCRPVHKMHENSGREPLQASRDKRTTVQGA